MTLRVVGNVGRANSNITVDEVMRDVPKTGAHYLDLRNGDLLVETTKASEPTPPMDLTGDVHTKPKRYTREELEGMKMNKLREIGRPLGARDTKKSELIDEILEFQ